MVLVVDDHLLLDLLTDTPSEWLRSESTRLGHLPDWIGLLGPRLLVPVMANLATRRQPNLLAAEALALALVVDGAVAVAVDSPLLRSGADDLGIAYHHVVGR